MTEAQSDNNIMIEWDILEIFGTVHLDDLDEELRAGKRSL